MCVYRCDLTFPTPKACVYVDFQLPEGYVTPLAAVCMRLMVKLVADALVELSYPAALAGAHYDCTNTQSGFQVRVRVCVCVRVCACVYVCAPFTVLFYCVRKCVVCEACGYADRSAYA